VKMKNEENELAEHDGYPLGNNIKKEVRC